MAKINARGAKEVKRFPFGTNGSACIVTSDGRVLYRSGATKRISKVCRFSRIEEALAQAEQWAREQEAKKWQP